MSLEGQVRTHEEWLRSIDSNLDRVTASLARMTERQDAGENRLAAVEQALAVVAQNQAVTAALQAAAERRADRQDAQIAQTEVALQKLTETLERYLRSRTNGHQN